METKQIDLTQKEIRFLLNALSHGQAFYKLSDNPSKHIILDGMKSLETKLSNLYMEGE